MRADTIALRIDTTLRRQKLIEAISVVDEARYKNPETGRLFIEMLEEPERRWIYLSGFDLFEGKIEWDTCHPEHRTPPASMCNTPILDILGDNDKVLRILCIPEHEIVLAKIKNEIGL